MGIPFTGTHQEGTEHVEADKVNDGKLAAAVLGGLVGLIGRSFLARPIERAGQHDLLPGFTCCAPDKQTGGCAHRHARRGTRVEEHTCTYVDVCLQKYQYGQRNGETDTKEDTCTKGQECW